MSGSERGLDAELFARLVAARAEHGRDPASTLCLASAEALGVAGAGLVLMSGTRALGCAGSSDLVAAACEEVEYTLGEGPCVTAHRTKIPAFDADLTDDRISQWPEFRRGARALGAGAAFGFPLLVNRICIGALNLYHDRPGALTDGQVSDALVVAAIASRTLLSWQAEAAPGTVAWQLEQTPGHSVEIHQATGRISVQAGVSLDDALVLLRAYAFSHEQPVSVVATEVATGRLASTDESARTLRRLRR